jgi:hypothetical protein
MTCKILFWKRVLLWPSGISWQSMRASWTIDFSLLFEWRTYWCFISECRQYITWKGMNRCLWQLIPQQGRQWLQSMPLHWQPKWAFFHNFNDLLSLWEYMGMPRLFEICLLLAVCCSDPFLILWFSETCDLMSFDDGSSAWFQVFSISSLSWWLMLWSVIFLLLFPWTLRHLLNI